MRVVEHVMLVSSSVAVRDQESRVWPAGRRRPEFSWSGVATDRYFIRQEEVWSMSLKDPDQSPGRPIYFV